MNGQVQGFPDYEVFRDGRVFSTRRGYRHELSAGRSSTGYYYLTLTSASGSKVQWRRSALVLTAFVGPRPPGHEAAHEDGNPSNDNLVNLSWKTSAANKADRIRHGTYTCGETHPGAKFRDAEVETMRWLRSQGWANCEIGRMFGINRHTAYGYISGRRRPKPAPGKTENLAVTPTPVGVS